MKNRVEVTINGMNFTLVSEADEEYMKKVAAMVDEKIEAISASGSGISSLAAAVLAAANIADELLKAGANEEKLRGEIRSYFDELSRLKDENAELRRELARLAPDSSKAPEWEERQSKLDLGEDDDK